MEFMIISISRKIMEKQYALNQKIKMQRDNKFEKITDKLETGFNVSGNSILCIIMLEICC